mgnify:CR=1 FL=1
MHTTQYEELKRETERLRYHIKLLMMMLPKETNDMFFQFVIDFQLSEIEATKILRTLAKIDASLNNSVFPEIFTTVNGEAIPFDTSVPFEQFGAQFRQYIQELFPDREINPQFLLKACKQQQLYPEVCDLLLEQILKKK